VQPRGAHRCEINTVYLAAPTTLCWFCTVLPSAALRPISSKGRHSGRQFIPKQWHGGYRNNSKSHSSSSSSRAANVESSDDIVYSVPEANGATGESTPVNNLWAYPGHLARIHTSSAL